MITYHNTLYRTLWRWHFYAGLFCIPFVVSLSLTGAIYLFKPQIEAWIDRDYQSLAITGERSLPAEQITSAKAHFPQASFVSYRLPQHNRQAVIITLSNEGQRVLLYINPYTLEVLKTVNADSQLIQIVRALHGELMLGNTGSIIIELAGCWAIVLVITGLYLWWPRSTRGLGGIVYPRLGKGRRTLWRDLHAVTGLWVAVFTLFLLISGLPWALVWSSAFKELRSLGAAASEQSWSVHHGGHSTGLDISKTLSPALLTQAMQLQFAHPVTLAPDKKHENQWKLSSGHQNRMLRADAWFNADNGELVKVLPFAERLTTDKIIGIGIAAHEGHLFGWLNQLLGLLVTAGLILLSISGFVLWRKRKPANVLGAPPAMANAHVGKVVLVITLGLAAVLPVLAISLIVIFILERFVLKRIARASAWLGLSAQ